MAFGDRHRERTPQEKKFEEAIKKEAEKTVLEIVNDEPVIEEQREPKIKIVRENRERKPKKKVVKKIVTPAKIEEKDGVENKKYVNIALNGTTVVCNDFRAIVKKKGLKITEVLTKIIGEWNYKNYNF